MAKRIVNLLAKLKKLTSKSDHPITLLLQTRSSGIIFKPECDETSVLITDLPAIPAASVHKVTSKLKRKDFFLAILPVEQYFIFGRQRFAEEVDFVVNKLRADDDFWATSTISDVLAYVIALKKDRKLFQNELFSMMLEALGALWNSSFADTSFFLFEQIMNLFLNCDGFVWNTEAVNSFSRYLVDNRALGESASAYVTRFLGLLIEQRCCDYSSLVEVVRMCLVEERPLISKRDIISVVTAVNVLLGQLNMTAFEIVAMSSKYGIYPAIENCFMVLVTILLSKVCEMEPSLVITKQSKKGSKRKSPRPDFEENQIEFLELDSAHFEDGVRQCDIPQVSILNLSSLTELRHLISSSLKALQSSSPEGVAIMMKTITDSFYMWKENGHIYDGFYLLLSFVNAFAKSVELEPILDFLVSPVIFDKDYTVFDRNLPDSLSLLRSMAVSVFTAKLDDQMCELIIRNDGNPVLAAEIMARCSDPKCRCCFCSEKAMVSILKVVWSLLRLYDQKKSDVFLDALHASLYFLFSLTEDPVSYASLFETNKFICGFVGIVFVRALRPMVLTRVRDFLVNNRAVSLECLCEYFANLIRKCKDLEDKRCEELVCSISDTLAYSLTHNMDLVASFKTTLQAMLEYAESKPSLMIMHSSVRFTNLMIQKTTDFQLGPVHIRQLVNIVQKVGVSDSVLHSIMNLCASATSISNRTLFLIKQPAVIPIAFAAFGKSEKLRDLTSYFIELCSWSPSNCVECHKSGIDEVFLDFIREFRWNDSRKVSFHGFEFELDFEDQDIDNLLFPFLSLVIHTFSNNVIAQKFLNLVLDTRHPNTAISVAHVVHNKLASLAGTIRPTFALGQREPCCRAKIVRDSAFERKFSFAFWLKIDQPISFQVQDSTEILSLKNVDAEDEHFQILLSRDALCISFKKTDLSRQAIMNLESNKWIFIAVVVQLFAAGKSAVAVFNDGLFGFCIDTDRISFNPEAELDVTIGGNGTGALVALIGPSILTHTVYTEDDLKIMEQRGPLCLDDEESYLFKTMECGALLPGEPEVTVYPPEVYENHHSFDKVLKEYNHDMTFLDLFKRLGDVHDGMIEIAIGIMKHLLQLSMPYAGIMRHYLMKYSSSHLTYSLYLALYSLTDVSKSEALFDNLIVNVELWSLSPAMCFIRVIHHWSNIAINACHQMFERPKYFSRLLKMFEYLFLKGNVNSRYQEAEIQRLHANFLGLIEATGRLNLGRRDVEFLFQLAYQVEDLCVKKEFITLCEVLASNISECTPNAWELFFALIDSGELEIAIATIHAIHQIASNNLHKAMLTVTMQLGTIPLRREIYNVIVQEIEQYPGLVVVACGLSLGLPESERMSLFETLERVSAKEMAMECLLSDKLWFLTPLLVFTQVSRDSTYGLLMFLAKGVCMISNQEERRRCFHYMIGTLVILESFVGFDFYGTILGLISAIDARSEGRVSDYMNDCLIAGFYRFSDFPMTRRMCKEIESSPFNDAIEKEETTAIHDLLALEQLLNRDFSNYSIHFALALDDSGRLLQADILQLVCQFGRLGEFQHKTKRSVCLLEFANYLCARSKADKQTEISIEKVNEWNERVLDVMEVVNRKLSQSIMARIQWMKELIKSAKTHVCTDHTKVLGECRSFGSALDQIFPTAPAMEQAAVIAYMRHRHSMIDLEQCKKERVIEFAGHLVPSKLRLVVEEEERQELLELSDSRNDMIRWSETSTVLISLCVKWYQFGEASTQHFDLTKDFVLLHDNLRITKFIRLEDVDMVLPRGDTAVEIFAFSKCSLYLDAAPMANTVIMHKFAAIHTRFTQPTDTLIQRLLSSTTTNFDYLMICGMFNGRSHHLRDSSPFLPVFDPKDPLNQTATDVSADQFYLPEVFGDTQQDAYEKRLQLEESDVSAYASTTYRICHKKCQVIPPKSRKSPLIVHTPVQHPTVVGFLSERLMFMKTENTVVFITIDETLETTADADFSLSGEICPVGESLLIISKDNMIQSARMSAVSEIVKVTMDMTMFTGDGDTFAFVGNECSVWTASIHDLSNYKRLIVSSRRIVALAINSATQLLVYGTDTCQLFVHSLLTGGPMAVVSLDGCAAERILISPSWGYILVLVNQRIRVYSMNGTFVHSVSLTSAVKEWHAFSDPHGIDYCIFADSGNRIGLFNVMKPKPIKWHVSKAMQVAAMMFSVQRMGIMAVTNEGTFSFSPFAVATV